MTIRKWRSNSEKSEIDEMFDDCEAKDVCDEYEKENENECS